MVAQKTGQGKRFISSRAFIPRDIVGKPFPINACEDLEFGIFKVYFIVLYAVVSL